ncbi:MAG: hypothetical protein M3037_12500 [Gemmatimonadota bacterium]|nr:hypothetical protein [Gemmatimonadota bacterium]
MRGGKPISAHRASAFRFEVGDGNRNVQLWLREGVVPQRFFALAGISHRTADEEAEFVRLKSEIAVAVMQQPPQDLFEISVRDSAYA